MADNMDTVIDMYIEEFLHIDELVKKLEQSTLSLQLDEYFREISNYNAYAYCPDMNMDMYPNGEIEFNRTKRDMSQKIYNSSTLLNQMITQNIEYIKDIQNFVINKKLKYWLQSQKISGNGEPLQINSLDEIQHCWFEKLYGFISSTRSVIENKQSIDSQYQLNGIVHLLNEPLEEVKTLLTQLIVSGFVVEKQPPQVIKTGSKYFIQFFY